MSLCEVQVQETNSDHFILSPPKLTRYFWGKNIALGTVIGKVICSEFFSLPLLGNYFYFLGIHLHIHIVVLGVDWVTSEHPTQPGSIKFPTLEPKIEYTEIPVPHRLLTLIVKM